MSQKYNWDDVRQTFTGAMTGVLGLVLFFVFGDKKSGLVINPGIGFLFTILFLILSYFSIRKMTKGAFQHLFFDYSISLIISIIIAYIFEMIDQSTLLSFNFFGTVPIIISWIIFIPAIVFDIKNVGGFIERYSYFGGTYNDKPTLCKSKYNTREEIENCVKYS